ncbi:MAG TPA: rhomboid family intramembrane serine protease [Anaeromyxobacteraceae bacterium]|nr:rhomboid family intramembrane serine protease [Anaeromyxobacteraceae bacterium]
MGIAHELKTTSEGRWAIVVNEAEAPAAESAIVAWEAENALRVELTPKQDYGRSRLGVAAALIIVAFTTFTFGPGSAWVERGRADAARIISGEWWRAATALTLHADATHAIGNAVALSVLLAVLARRLGPALAAWLALGAGIAGNVVTALLTRSGHISVGASTAVFGALGTLSALQVPERRAWLTLGAGVALLGLLGTGERADLFAHLSGFTFGVVEGLALRTATSPRRSFLQPAVALTSLAPIALAWWWALRG